MENFKEIERFSNWKIGDEGTVYSKFLGRNLRPNVNKNGYVVVRYKDKDMSRGALVHRLVYEAFNGPIAEGMQINHKNGIKTDNRLENLEATTPSENITHAYDNNLIEVSFGESHWKAKLNNETAKEAILAILAGESNVEIGRRLGVERGTISAIRQKRTWKHVWAELEGVTTSREA